MSTQALYIPESTARLLNSCVVGERHPGLQLDKFCVVPKKQEQQKESLQEICRTRGDSDTLNWLNKRRAENLGILNAVTWQCETAGPLTLHLARASALENAGICLHPVYGFVYLPGSGLKGMARAYAETVWFKTQPDPAVAWADIEAVFGWAPHSDDRKPWKPGVIPKHGKGDAAQAGSVVFHDAWPKEWPSLQLDIVNNHHTKYYQGTDAPGDWEDPSMVSFLAIGPKNSFCFALSTRKAGIEDRFMSLAREWLTGALCHLGAGAKTAAGYGSFRPVEGPVPQLDSPAIKTFETTLELVTPAFLAGPHQDATDCDLRPATLRGLLRWWWRTMHAGFVDTNTLRALEAAVWGDTEHGGAVRVTVEKAGKWRSEPYNKQQKALMGDDQKKSALGIPGCQPKTTTQGLWYASFGMDERDRKRSFVPSGAQWRVKLQARDGFIGKKGDRVSALVLLEQARMALGLLCQLGGVGSKSRKGFGCFKDLKDFSLQRARESAKELRAACRVAEHSERDADSPSLGAMLPLPEVSTPWKDPWFALDQLGFAMQAFAKKYSHDSSKKALGLPRKVGTPSKGRFDTNFTRFASPVHYHLAGGEDGCLRVRVTAFPAPKLPNLKESGRFLGELLEHLQNDLKRRTVENSEQRIGRETSPANPVPDGMTKPGDRVEAVLVDEKTNKGGWRAKCKSGDHAGPIQNSNEVPEDKKPGDTVTLIVANRTDFRWPTRADEEREKKAQKKPGGGPGRGGPGFSGGGLGKRGGR